MGTTVAVARGATAKEIKKYAKSAREQKRAVRRQIAMAQKKVRREKRGVKVWKVVRRILGIIVIMAQLIGSVAIVTAIFRTEVLSVWQAALVIMGLTLLLFINAIVLL